MDADATIRSIADKQLHLVTTKQLRDTDLTWGQISRRVAKGTLTEVYRGVYLIAGAEPSFEQRSLGACLTCGESPFHSRVIHNRRTSSFISYLERDDVQRLPGIGVLRKIAIDRAPAGTPESVLETRAIRVLLDNGFPEPVRQYTCTIAGRRVRFDLAYPDRGFGVDRPALHMARRHRATALRRPHDRECARRPPAPMAQHSCRSAGFIGMMRRVARPATQTTQWTNDPTYFQRMMRRLCCFFTAALLVFVVPSAQTELRPTAREGAGHAVPLFGEMIRPYDAPDDPFAAGHRGIDVAAPFGSPVRASAPGTVSFAGVVNANRTVTVDHGDGVRTSYSFLAEIRVARNQYVELGQVVGTVGDGHAANQPSHVHLSARRDGTYFDPLRIYVGTSYEDLLELVA